MIDLSSGTTVLTLSGVYVLYMIVLSIFIWREDRRRFAEVFATIAPAIDGEVVANNRLEGHWSTYSVEVVLAGTVAANPAFHAVTLHVGSGGCAWAVHYGRRPRVWRSKEWHVRRSKEWHVQSRNPAVVERLEWLGAPTLVAQRYRQVKRPFLAELEPPCVGYEPDRGRLSYGVAVAEGRMTSLTLEQFGAQLELLRQLAELDRQANQPVYEEETPAATDTSAHQVSRLACVAIGVTAAVVALLPWLVTGMRLPLQNLWAVQTLPEDMPIAFLPFSQYAVTQIFSMLLVGYGTAGIVVRALRTRLPHRAVLAVGAGVLTVHLVATLQAARAVASGLTERTASTVYLAALLAVVAAAVLTGLLVLWLITAPPTAGAVIGLSLSALVVSPWLADLLMPLGTAPGGVPSSVLNLVVRWVPAVLVGAAISWGGHGRRGQYVAAVGSLLLLWIVPAAFTAVTSAAGSRVLLPYPSEMVDYGLEVLRAAMFAPELVLPPLLVALVLAAVGIPLHRLRGRRLANDEA